MSQHSTPGRLEARPCASNGDHASEILTGSIWVWFQTAHISKWMNEWKMVQTNKMEIQADYQDGFSVFLNNNVFCKSNNICFYSLCRP